MIDGAWHAVGDAARDLPSWARASPKARIASATTDLATCEGAALELACFTAFSEALHALGADPTRVWAFLPRITDDDQGGLDRYMRMNLGRARAYRSAVPPMSFMPAGTCTGHAGHHLVVHALHMPGPSIAIENPRQRPAWAYSDRFGPQSPPFTRGVLVDGLLIASGTASVVGEETLHPDDPVAQWHEATANLDALRSAASARGAWRSLQIYVSDRRNLAAVRTMAEDAFGRDGAVERVLHAPLCRKSLLLELEGVCVA